MAQLAAKPVHLDSVKVHIPFYGNLNDWSGWNNNGQVDSFFLGTDRYGNAQRSLVLNQRNRRLVVPARHLNTNTFSLAFWYRFLGLPTDTLLLASIGDGQCHQSFYAWRIQEDSLEIAYQYDSLGSKDERNFRIPFDTLNWNHFTFMKSKDSVYCFVNAFFRQEVPFGRTVCAEADSLYFGPKEEHQSPLNMLIDEVRWYSENIEPSILFSIYTGERLALQEPESQVLIFPNPSRGILTIQSDVEIDEVSLFSMDGRLVHTQKKNRNDHAVDLQHVRPGVYLMRLFSNEAGSKYVKVVIEE